MNSTKDNPFAQDSLPIGTVVEWEGKKVEVIESEDCTDCIFFERDCFINIQDANCPTNSNSDGISRKYILINEQEEEAMSIKLENGKKYVTEAGDITTVRLVRELDNPYLYRGDNKFNYTIAGKLYSNGDCSRHDIVKEYVEETEQEPERHVHAELMVEYGKDALISKTPWKGWEFNSSNTIGGWDACRKTPIWEETCRYRRKPKTILINGYEVPEPIRNLPDLGKSGISETVWIPSLTEYPSFALGVGNSYTRVFFDRGLCHLTKEAAELHAKALLSFTTTL